MEDEEKEASLAYWTPERILEREERSRRARSARAKGARIEREAAKIFSAWWGKQFKRSAYSGAYGTMAEDAPEQIGDLRTPPDFPYTVEVKAVELSMDGIFLKNRRSSAERLWDQAKAQAEKAKKKPLLVLKRRLWPYIVVGIGRLDAIPDGDDVVIHTRFGFDNDLVFITGLEFFMENFDKATAKT